MNARSTDHVATAMRARADDDPEHAAFVVHGPQSTTVVSYAAFVQRVARATAFLGSRGLAAGDRCALIGGNHPDWCAAWYAIVSLGAVAVPLDPQLLPAAAAALLDDAGARFAVVDVRAQAMSAGWKQLERVFWLSDEHGALFSSDVGHVGAPRDLVGGAGDLAALLYTSGTTAEPKGVMLTHKNLVASVESTVAALGAARTDVSLSVLPFHHILAQIGGMLAPLAVGATVALLPEIDLTRIAAVLREGGITIFSCVPQFYHLLLRHVRTQVETSVALRRVFPAMLRWNMRARSIGLNAGRLLFSRVHAACGPKMRVLLSGGAPLDPEVARTFHALGIDLLQVYGLTETAGAIAIGRPGEVALGSVGRAVAGAEIRIDVEDTRASAEAPGEILVRGPMVTQGYYNRPDEGLAKDGWLHTGDLGYLTEDGFLYVLGRGGDTLILPSGKKVQPEEIEVHLGRSSLIDEVGVTLAPGDAGGDPRLHAVVVPDLEAIRAAGSGNVEQAIREEISRLSAELQPYKRITGVTITRKPLPRTTTRKLKRAPLKAWVTASHAAERIALRPVWHAADLAWLEEPAHARALGRIAARVGRPRGEIHPDLHLDVDLGLDSLARLSLLADLDVPATGEVLATLHSVRELVEAANARPAVDGSAGAPVEEARRLSRSLVLTGIAFGLSRFIRAAAHLLLRLRVDGDEHLRPPGAALICPNHQSYLDVFLVLCVLPWQVFRRTCMVAKPRYIRGLLPLLGRIGVVPIDASRNLPGAVEESVGLLRNGAVLLVFPEGTRSWDGTLGTFRHGAVAIALRAHAPMIPVAIDGSHRVMPRGHGLRALHPVTIRAGKPLVEEELVDPQVGTNTLRARVASLLARAGL
jgi:long-chain acyl-CoA synthetase